jgi:hypothetical protein
MAVNPKAKGSSFEREIAKSLSLWWSEGKRDDIFYRTQSSGGRYTSRKKSGKNTDMQAGDIAATVADGEPLLREWSIEIKTGYGKRKGEELVRWDLLDCVDSRQKTPVIQQMWNQCKRDADLSKREPILIFRRNNRIPCIMFRSAYGIGQLEDYFGEINVQHLILKSSMNCIIMPLQEFFDWIPNIRPALKKTVFSSEQN